MISRQKLQRIQENKSNNQITFLKLARRVILKNSKLEG
jgi:hypothetical protein